MDGNESERHFSVIFYFLLHSSSKHSKALVEELGWEFAFASGKEEEIYPGNFCSCC